MVGSNSAHKKAVSDLRAIREFDVRTAVSFPDVVYASGSSLIGECIRRARSSLTATYRPQAQLVLTFQELERVCIKFVTPNRDD